MLARDFRWRGALASEMGMIVTEQVQYRRPAEHVTTFTVPGRSGTLRAVEKKSWEDVIYAPACAMLPGADRQAILDWLTGDGEVTFGSMPDYVFTARISDAFDTTVPAHADPHSYLFLSPVFVCHPLRRRDVQTPPIVLTAETQTHVSPANTDARPVLIFRASGAADVRLNIAGRQVTLQLDGPAENMRIDTDTLYVTGAPEAGWSVRDGTADDLDLTIPPGPWGASAAVADGSSAEVSVLVDPRYRWL